MRLTTRFILCLTLSLTASCSLLDPLRKSECNWAKPIVTAPEDTLTRPTKEQIVAHNLKVKEFCR